VSSGIQALSRPFAEKKMKKKNGLRKSLQVNLGPRTELSSKVINLLQGHHCEGSLFCALELLLRRNTRASVEQAHTQGELRPRSVVELGLGAKVPLCDLHFWLACPSLCLEDLPTTSQCQERNRKFPRLSEASRAAVWRVFIPAYPYSNTPDTSKH